MADAFPESVHGRYHILHALPDTYPSQPHTADPHSGDPSENVVNLNLRNFDEVIEDKEKAIIMFYNGSGRKRPELEAAFATAAGRSTNHKFVFGRVDCSKQRLLCSGENICNAPVLKVYSYGYDVSMIRNPERMNADQIFMLIMMTSVMPSSKINLSHSITSKSSGLSWKNLNCFSCV